MFFSTLAFHNFSERLFLKTVLRIIFFLNSPWLRFPSLNVGEEEIGLRYALRGRKKNLRYNFQKCPKGPKSPRSYFFWHFPAISDIYLWPSCSLSLWEIWRLYLKGLYLDNIYRYWEIDKIYWSLHELGAYPSHSSSSWVSLKKLPEKAAL